MKELKNIHPGEILLEEFLLPMDISQNELARQISVSPRRINEIVHGNRSITADTDLRLAKYFGVSEGYWLGLQSDHDLLEKKRELESALKKIPLFSYSQKQKSTKAFSPKGDGDFLDTQSSHRS